MLADHGLVQRRLLGRQRDIGVGLGLARQLRRDVRVGFLAPQQEGADQGGQALGDHLVVVPFDRLGDHPAEMVQRTEQARRRPVQDRPQLGEPVLHRGAGQRHPRAGFDAAQRLRRRGQRILHMLGLVRSDETPLERGERFVTARYAIRREHDLPRSQIVKVARAAVEPAYRHRWRELGDLTLPVAQQRGRADHERRTGGERLAMQVQVQRDQLDRLAQSHVVGEAGAQPELGHLDEPGEARALIRAQYRQQPRRRLHRFVHCGRDALGQAGQHRRRRERDLLTVELRLVGERRAQCLRAGQRPFLAPELGEQHAVRLDPLAAQADDRPLGLRQHRDLVLGQHLVAHADLPFEVQQVLEGERGPGIRLGRLDARLGLHPREQRLGPEHGDADFVERAPAVREQMRHLVVGQHELVRLLLDPAQRRPDPGATPDAQQQLRLHLAAEPPAHLIRHAADLRGVGDEARVREAAEHGHGPHLEARHAVCVERLPRLDAQEHLRAARRARDAIRGQATRQHVRRRVPQRADQRLRRVQPGPLEPRQGERVRLRRQRGRQLTQARLVLLVERAGAPAIAVGRARETRSTPAVTAADQAATVGLARGSAFSSLGMALAIGTTLASTLVRTGALAVVTSSSIGVSPYASPHSASTPSRGGSEGT